MKLPHKFPRLHAFKFAPFTIVAFFLLTNFTGLFFTKVFAPSVSASTVIPSMTQDGIPADIPSSGNREIDQIIFRAGGAQGVDPRFIHAVIWQESRYENEALSAAGAQGLMQLMPATAKRFGCKDPHDAAANIQAGTKYLAWLLKRFNGDIKLALAGYNAGEGAVDRYNGVPPYEETQNYVSIITSRYGKTYHPVLSPEEARIAFHLQTSAGE
jgi:soluble lytic murein transglycosylase-like protein